MVVQILTDARQMVNRLNAAAPKMVGRADAGQHQKLR